MKTPGLILPPGMDKHADVRRVLQQHNAALQSLHPLQSAAINRIVLASLLVQHMTGGRDLPKDQQQSAAQVALAEVIRREANGETLDVIMWTKPIDLHEDQVDEMVKATLKEGGRG
jgi:hypothetical protein